MQALNERNCECGCGMGSVAVCAKKDPNCPRSPKMAKQAVDMVKQGKTLTDLLAYIDTENPKRGRSTAAGRGPPGRREEGRHPGARAPQGPQARQGHHRRVQRLPVPVLLAGESDPEGDHRQVRQGRGDRVREPAAVLPRPGAGRRQGLPGRQQAGQGLGDARQDVRQPAGADARRPGQVRGRGGPERGPLQEGHGRSGHREDGRRRSGAGRLGGRRRHADVLPQRPRDLRRAALPGLPDHHRRGDQEGRRAAEAGDQAG